MATIVDNQGNVLFTSAFPAQVNLATALAGEDFVPQALSNGLIVVEHRYAYKNSNTATTTQVKAGAGLLHTIAVMGGTLGAITVYDNTVGSGTTVVPTFTPAAANTWVLDVAFTTGLTIVTAAATILVVSYR